MKVYYFSDVYEPAGIYQSQVRGLFDYQSQLIDFHLIALVKRTSKFSKEGRNLHLVKRLPLQYLLITSFFQALLVIRKIRLNEADVIHCRGHICSAIAIIVRSLTRSKFRVLADIRGAIVQEKQMKNGNLAKFFVQGVLLTERLVFRSSDYFLFVSDEMASFYKSQYSFSNYDVLPTLVNKDLFKPTDSNSMVLERKYKLRGKKILIYIGGTSVWQNIDKIIQTFGEMIQYNNELFMFFISNEKERIEKMIFETGVDSKYYSVLSLTYEEIPEYLNLAEYGVIIRDENIVNRVASPIKINEYLACGLKILTSIEGMKSLTPQSFDHYPVDISDAAILHSNIYKSLLS